MTGTNLNNEIQDKIAEAVGASKLEPQTETEKALANIWREFFNIEVTAETDFFEIGGNSLTVIKLLARVEEIFGEDVLSPDAVFETEGLRQMAAAIDTGIGQKK